MDDMDYQVRLKCLIDQIDEKTGVAVKILRKDLNGRYPHWDRNAHISTALAFLDDLIVEAETIRDRMNRQTENKEDEPF